MIKSFTAAVAFVFVSSLAIRAEDSVQRVVKGLKESTVAAIQVFGAPEVVESNEAINAKVLAQVAKHRFSFDPRSSAWRTRSLVYALQSARPVANNSQTGADGFDLRWGCILQGHTGGEQHQIYLDGWQNEGLVDGHAYVFSPRLRTWFYLVTIGSYYWAGLSVCGWAFIVFIAVVAIILFATLRILKNRRVRQSN